MEIRFAESLTEDERERLFGWGEDIFGASHLNIKWRQKDWHVIVDADSHPQAHVGMLRHTVTVGDRSVRVCGVGGVVTALGAQGRGYAGRAMRYAQALMCDEWAVDFGLLFCLDRLIPFYERLGWRLVGEEVEVEQPSGATVAPLNVMVLPCKEREWPAGRVRLNSLPW